jgi:uncharacterized protein
LILNIFDQKKRMDFFLIILGVFFIILGIAGCILPVIPGPPIAYLALLMLQLSSKPPFSIEFMLIFAFLTIAVTILDYIVPVWGTKKFGGSKYGVWGSTIGLIIGLFFGPLGIIIGPFIGAFIGELIAEKQAGEALRAALGAFIGFVAGTLMKLAVSIAMAVPFFRESWQYFRNLFS